MTKKFLTKSDILGSKGLKEKTIFIPEWGGSVTVRELTAGQRDHFEEAIVRRKGRKVTVDTKGLRARLVVMSVVDPKTKDLVFTENDISALMELSGSALDRIFTEASKLSGLNNQELTENL